MKEVSGVESQTAGTKSTSPQICKDSHANWCSTGHVHLRSRDHEVEMNSTLLRTKLLNEKSSNIYEITKHFPSGSVSVPGGKSPRRQSTGQALNQVLHCTGTSPQQHATTPQVKGHPRNAWQGTIKEAESSELVTDSPRSAPASPSSPSVPVGTLYGVDAALAEHHTGHMLRCTQLPGAQAGGICTSSLVIPPSDFVSLPSGPTWYHLDILPPLVWLCTSNARRNLVWANLLCTSSPFPAPQCEPIAAPPP